MRRLALTARSCSVLLDEAGDYWATSPVQLTLNGVALGEEKRSVFSLFDLRPDAEYCLEARRGGEKVGELRFHTAGETCALDVRRFGAVGDGLHDDTPAIQAALLCCPPGGRVFLGAGDYRVGPLFLKSHITLELKRGATLRLIADRARFPILPGSIPADNPAGELLLGSWEGNPLDCYAAALTGIGVEDVRVIGEGTVDGCAQDGDWWQHTHTRTIAWRGNLFFLRGCKHITVQGIHFANSPC